MIKKFFSGCMVVIQTIIQQAGLSVWYDKAQARTGDRLTDKIEQAIRQSAFFLPLFSPEYWTSEW